MNKRTTLKALGTLAAAGFLTPAFAQQFPNRPIRMVVPFPPGGPADILSRIIAQKISMLRIDRDATRLSSSKSGVATTGARELDGAQASRGS